MTGYEASSVPCLAVGGGTLWDVAEFAMGFEVALRWADSPAIAAGRSLDPASGAGSRWSVPIGLVLRF